MNDLNRQRAEDCLAAIREAFPDVDQTQQQTLCLMEEIGEVTGEVRRYLGWARRPGNRAALAEELADVVIVTYVCAAAWNVELVDVVLAYTTDPFDSLKTMFFHAAQLNQRAARTGELEVLLCRIRDHAYAIAREFNIDMQFHISAKWEKTFSRGWKDPR